MIARDCKQNTLLVLGVLLAVATNSAAQQQWQSRGIAQNIEAERQLLLAEVPAVETYNVLLITVDSLTPSSLGCYGSTLSNPSPHIDRLAKESQLFRAAFASSPDPDIGLLSLSASLLPSALSAGMSDTCPSMTTLFADHNFSTRGILSKQTINALKARLERVDESLGFGRRISKSSSAATMASVAARLISGTGSQAMFVHVHLDPTRAPATTHPGFDFGTKPKEHYAAAVRWVDQAVGQITQTLHKSKVDQRTIIILTSPSPGHPDGAKVRPGLFDSNLHVPLMISVPGLTARDVTTPVSTIDIAPTLASLYGIPSAYSFQGRSFLSALTGSIGAPRQVFSEDLSSRLEGAAPLAMSVRSEKWRLTVRQDGGQSLLNSIGAAATQTEAKAAPVAELTKTLEDSAVYVTACNQMWGRGDETQPDMEGVQGKLSRAEWLVASHDKRAHSAVLELIGAATRPSPTLMEFLLKVGEPNDRHLAHEALSSDDIEVRALAGAFLALQGDANGLSHVIAGLRPSTKPHRQVILLNQLGSIGDPTSLKPILSFQPTDPTAKAARTLALIRLGHLEAEGELIRHILDPTALFAKDAFLETYVQRFPQRSAGVLSLALSNGDSRPETLLSVLREIDRAEASHLHKQVAGTIPHEDKRVRERALSLLQKWDSLSGVEGLLQLSATSPDNAGWVANRIMQMPLLIGSPAVPGLRLDALSAGKDPSKLINGFSRLDWAGLTFAFQLASRADVNHLAVVFQSPTQSFAAADIAIILNGKRISTKQGKIDIYGDMTILTVAISKDDVEQGANQVHLRAKPTTTSAIPLAFFALAHSERDEVQGGAEKTGKGILKTIALNRDLRVFRLWVEGVGTLPTKTTKTRVEVLCDEGSLGIITLPREGGVLARTLKLPTRVWRLKNLRLQIEGGSETQRAVAVITGFK